MQSALFLGREVHQWQLHLMVSGCYFLDSTGDCAQRPSRSQSGKRHGRSRRSDLRTGCASARCTVCASTAAPSVPPASPPKRPCGRTARRSGSLSTTKERCSLDRMVHHSSIPAASDVGLLGRDISPLWESNVPSDAGCSGPCCSQFS